MNPIPVSTSASTSKDAADVSLKFDARRRHIVNQALLATLAQNMVTINCKVAAIYCMYLFSIIYSLHTSLSFVLSLKLHTSKTDSLVIS